MLIQLLDDNSMRTIALKCSLMFENTPQMVLGPLDEKISNSPWSFRNTSNNLARYHIAVAYCRCLRTKHVHLASDRKKNLFF